MTLTIDLNIPDGLDLERLLECTSDALYMDDNVTAKEQAFIIELIQKIKKQVDNEN